MDFEALIVSCISLLLPPCRPSPTKGFLSWLGALGWHGLFYHHPWTHRSDGKVRMVKKMQDETEGAVRKLSSRASKRAPTWHSSPITPKSLSGQPLDRVWIRLARKGFWGNGWAMSCGGSFWSSWWERSHSAFSFVLHFFYQPNLVIWTMCIRNSHEKQSSLGKKFYQRCFDFVWNSLTGQSHWSFWRFKKCYIFIGNTDHIL